MGYRRRDFIKGISALLALSFTDLQKVVAGELANSNNEPSPINVIVPRTYSPPSDYSHKNYRYRLTRATLSVLKDNFSHTRMPVWDKYYSEVDLEKRISNIVYWLQKAVTAHRRIYPVDPAWILAQIMKESYFYEYAVSRSLAVGICQFIQPTAQSHGMLCAGKRSEHFHPPFRKTGFAGKADEYYRLRAKRRRYHRKNKPSQTFDLETALKIIRSGQADQYEHAAGEYLDYLKKLADLDEKRRQAMEDFRTYLRENIRDRDIFNRHDLNFILGFDERFTYKKPVFAMVKMIANGLRARNGNILAASIGYNAGLSSTLEDAELYKPYGKIPAIEQATTYLSHVLINHYEIVHRME